jgi:HlyD family secretion protein
MTRALLEHIEPAGLLPAPEERHQPEKGAPKNDRPDDSSHDDGEPPKPFPKLPFIIAFIVLVALLASGAWRHWQVNEQAASTQQQEQDFVPQVRVADAKRDDGPIKIVLPAQTEAWKTATIYARATGYVAERRVDIGSRVKKGDLLVKISAPDLDQQLSQAKAQLEQMTAALEQAKASVDQAQANLALQTTNLARANTLTRQGFETTQNQQTQQTTVESQQASLATAKAGVKVSEANVKGQQATVDRLEALASFEDVKAPFDGVVTARNIEVGDLVTENQGSGTAMFTIDEDDILRVAINVPQFASDGVRDGLDAKVTIPQMPGRTFTGKVSRTSVALMYSSRTLTTEVDVNNPDGVLSPGQFVNVEIDIPRTTPSVIVPSDALVFDQRGTMVATVEDDKAKFHKVEIARDMGTSLDLKSGLNGGEKVILGGPVDLTDGEKVTIAPPPKHDAKDNQAASTK